MTIGNKFDSIIIYIKMAHLLYTSTITGVNFHLSGTEEVRRDSYVQITSPDTFRNNLPYPGGVYDAHTGTNAHEYRCQTCYNKKAQCLGHEGHIELNYPVWNPLGFTDGKKWLKLICFKCGKPTIPESDFLKINKAKRLDEASKIARTGFKVCVHCNTPHPIIKKGATEPLLCIAEYYVDKKLDHTDEIYPHLISEILSRVSDATVIKLGKHPSSHPRHFILYAIRVPAITVRPDVKKMGGGRSTNDDLTTALQIIIKRNDTMPAVIPPIIDDKMRAAIFEINNAFYDFVRAGGEGSMNSLAKREKGKQGMFRRNQLGKRARNMARSTIIGSTQIKIDEIGVPIVFARIIQYEETVQEFNKRQLLEYVQNGSKRYPGATKIIKRSTGKSYDVDNIKDIELENGDVVYRDMLDGDPVNINRQPSLKVSNIGTHKAVIIRDQRVKTLVMNVIACVLYDADFNTIGVQQGAATCKIIANG